MEQTTTRRRLGDQAEDRTVRFLEAAGYQIRHRNFTCRYGEVDVVAEKDRTLCFVEVRMRTTAQWGDPALTVSFAKQRRVVKTALHYLFRHALGDRMVRFDVVSILGQGPLAKIDHIPNAFDAGM